MQEVTEHFKLFNHLICMNSFLLHGIDSLMKINFATSFSNMQSEIMRDHLLVIKDYTIKFKFKIIQVLKKLQWRQEKHLKTLCNVYLIEKAVFTVGDINPLTSDNILQLFVCIPQPSKGIAPGIHSFLIHCISYNISPVYIFLNYSYSIV